MSFKLNMDADINGTSLQGYVNLKYSDIVEAFGEGDDCGDKTTQEWMFESVDGKAVFTLYDWKQDSTPKGEYRWHIGGQSDKWLPEFISWLTKEVKNNGLVKAKFYRGRGEHSVAELEQMVEAQKEELITLKGSK